MTDGLWEGNVILWICKIENVFCRKSLIYIWFLWYCILICCSHQHLNRSWKSYEQIRWDFCMKFLHEHFFLNWKKKWCKSRNTETGLLEEGINQPKNQSAEAHCCSTIIIYHAFHFSPAMTNANAMALADGQCCIFYLAPCLKYYFS